MTPVEDDLLRLIVGMRPKNVYPQEYDPRLRELLHRADSVNSSVQQRSVMDKSAAAEEGAHILRSLYVVCEAQMPYDREGAAYDDILPWELVSPPWISGK